MTTTKKGFLPSWLRGGLWVILVLAFGFGIFFIIQGVRSAHSGSTQQVPGVGTVVSEENVSFFATIGVFGIILIVAGIIIALLMRADK